MKVLKFGGTSVGTVESLLNVKKIMERLDGASVVVVSALGGLTDRLIATAKMAKDADPAIEDEISAMIERHHNIIDGVVPEKHRNHVREKVDALLGELAQIYRGVALIKELPPRTLDRIVSYGEQMSSVIVSHMLPRCKHQNSLEIVKTEKWFNKDIADTGLTERNICNSIITTGDTINVMGGFISTDRDTGEITNLGRGGSDYTAALVAAALNADVLEIWTDVDGFMTADPRIISDAVVVSHMSFVESMELCSFGAKVIYPPTIYPVFHKNIPIRILNTHNPDAPGTLIDDNAMEGDLPIKGVSALKQTALISIAGSGAVNVADVSSRTYNTLAKNGISVFLVANSEGRDSLKFAISDIDTPMVTTLLEREFEPELNDGSIEAVTATRGLSTLAVVGENLHDMRGLGSRLYNIMQRDGIDVEAASDGSSATTLTYVVFADQTEHALRLLHESVFS